MASSNLEGRPQPVQELLFNSLAQRSENRSQDAQERRKGGYRVYQVDKGQVSGDYSCLLSRLHVGVLWAGWLVCTLVYCRRLRIFSLELMKFSALLKSSDGFE